MTDLDSKPAETHLAPLSHATLPGWAPWATVVVGLVVGAIVGGVMLGGGVVATVVVAWLVVVLALPLWSRAVEGGRKGTDRLVTVLVWSTFGLAMIPLVSLTWQVVSKGVGILSPQFFQNSMAGVLGSGGGIYHALMGTLIITALATLISVPIGVLTAVYLVEYGKNNTFSRIITFLVDVMTGIPSIVAGLFAYALFVAFFGPGVKMGFAGSIALSVLMIPVVVRSTEEMLKLVPADLREASYALGVPKWRTITKVVMPTAVAGIVTGVTLAVARVAGETAPLLLTAGLTNYVNFNPFDGRMTTLPVFIYYAIKEPGIYAEEMTAYAWGAALVLVVIVMALNVVARVIGGVFAPKTGR
ncbi:phosphate ABC transporter permease PstA [Nocardioides bruguierae]|uniref:Phosphate transport system permease protein PstA n=1 Tax=Nocardioides bruguierae TaxID=2945102 RepID=A0A9X2IGH1_9ACTN|nr:phosphate ABC transporter permease PstA [Nocardioides bruguierae]MCM0621564.1 phosphate ABC transporter permease PstA [Nocardioides bruguierae]